MVKQVKMISRIKISPRVVSFDAFGTIYTPKEPVSVQYYNIAKKYIPNLEKVQESSVLAAIIKARDQFPNYGKYNIGMSQQKWWTRVIEDIFEGHVYDRKMVDEIFDHFVDRNAYHVYPDVEPLLQQLKSQGVELVVCSNSDDRLRKVMRSLDLDKYFSKYYLSYDLDCSKPDALFLLKVVQDLGLKLSLNESDLKKQMWHIGDDFRKDYRFAIDNGIRGVYVDREMVSGYVTEDKPVVELEENGIATKDLSYVMDMYEKKA